MIRDLEDAYGQEVYAYFMGEDALEIVERDDGFINTFPGPEYYLQGFEDWPTRQQEAMDFVEGRVLDVGCGAGRVSLYLQERGFEVLGIDNSPKVLQVCRLRGVKHLKLMPITQVGKGLGEFDTIVMMGNNFGLFGSPRRARWLLRRWKRMTSSTARIIAESNDVLKTDAPYHLAYHEFNRKRGRLPGELRFRVRFRNFKSPWFDYLMVSREEMDVILEDTGWMVSHIIQKHRTCRELQIYVIFSRGFLNILKLCIQVIHMVQFRCRVHEPVTA